MKTEIEQLHQLIDDAQAQGADWDDQEGTHVSVDTAAWAKETITSLVAIAKDKWIRPSISATPDGGIHFSWMTRSERSALTIFATNSGYRTVGQFHKRRDTSL